jgi:uncharacterized MnhB-related membrane protein
MVLLLTAVVAIAMIIAASAGIDRTGLAPGAVILFDVTTTILELAFTLLWAPDCNARVPGGSRFVDACPAWAAP